LSCDWKGGAITASTPAVRLRAYMLLLLPKAPHRSQKSSQVQHSFCCLFV